MIIHRRVDGFKTQKCAPKGAFSCTMFHFSIAHPIGIVGERPCSSAVGHACQLAAILPGISPDAVGQRITNRVIGDRVAIVRGQQVAPIRVGIAVNNGIGGWWERFF